MPTLQFKGKPFVQNHHLAVKYHQLVPNAKNSLTDKISLHDNLIIQGDNLKALKALLPTYGGKVKCIYIDPPYNTGNEGWQYNDNVNNPMMQEWMGKVVDTEDMTRHDKWLCMMIPRLKLLRELLAEDGAIFISCDDNEQHNLRCLLDEIFGEQNFIQNIIWQKKFSPQNDAKYFSDNHDFIICYAKNKIEGENKTGWMRNLLPRTEKMDERYSNPDNDERGDWSSSDMLRKEIQQSGMYEIKTPSGRVCNPPPGTSWRVPEYKYLELLKENRIWFGKDGKGVPRIKRFINDVKDGIVPISIWLHQEVGHNQDASKEIKEIFKENENPFATPKPVSLIKRIIQIACNKNDIILDSFAGSGTTAHAVLDLNKEDGGNRKFILVEMEEYANDITAERVRRVINGVPTSKNFKEGTGGTFSYFELGKAIEMSHILDGTNLPSYIEFARYLFYTATGDQFDESKVSQKTGFIGESTHYEVYLVYKPDIEYLKSTALTLEMAKALPEFKGKQRLVFAPMKYLDQDYLRDLRIDFCQLPYEIYKMEK